MIGKIPDYDENERITINVGGRIFETKKSTLLSSESYFFHVMLSDRWTSKTENNEYFIDRSATYFDFVMDYLRYHEPLDRSLFSPLQVKLIEKEFDFYHLSAPFPQKVMELSTNISPVSYNFWGLVLTIKAKTDVTIAGFEVNLTQTTNCVNIYMVDYRLGNTFGNFKTPGWVSIYSNQNFKPNNNGQTFTPVCDGLKIDIVTGKEFSFYFHCKTTNGVDGTHSPNSAGGLIAPATYSNDGVPYIQNDHIALIRGVNTNSSTMFENANTNCFEWMGKVLYWV